MEATSANGFSIAVLAASDRDEATALALSRELQLQLCPTSTRPRDVVEFHALVICSSQGISLQQTGRAAPGPIVVEFGNAAMRHRRRGSHNELLGKAVGPGEEAWNTCTGCHCGSGQGQFYPRRPGLPGQHV